MLRQSLFLDSIHLALRRRNCASFNLSGGTRNLRSYSNSLLLDSPTCDSRKKAPVRRTKKEPTLEQSNRVIDHDPRGHHYSKDEGSFFLIILETVTGAIGTFEHLQTALS